MARRSDHQESGGGGPLIPLLLHHSLGHDLETDPTMSGQRLLRQKEPDAGAGRHECGTPTLSERFKLTHYACREHTDRKEGVELQEK